MSSPAETIVGKSIKLCEEEEKEISTGVKD